MSQSGNYPSGPSAPPLVTVRCSDWGAFLDLYTKDISHGGLFIETTSPLPVFTKLKVRLVVAEESALVLAGDVVHVVAADPAKAGSAKPGMGVQLSPLSVEEKQVLKDLVRLARKRTGLSPLETNTDTYPGLVMLGTGLGSRNMDPKQLLAMLREQLTWFRQRDAFSALGLTPPVTIAAARKVYFKLCKRYHPDLYTRYKDPQLSTAVTELFALIQNAFNLVEARLLEDTSRIAADTLPPRRT